jgi:hypothetical protein
MSKKMTRVAVALLLLVTFTAGAAPAAPWSLAGPEPSRLAALWDWIASWFQSSTVEEGCPNGGCSSGGNPEEGPHMDPNG